MKNTDKFIVITSIFPPSEAVRKFASLPDWQLIVVGDKKTPENWELKDVIYLGPKQQTELGFETSQHLPWNHYCRKLIGYLYAMKLGAKLIADSDDDNLPYEDWPRPPDEASDFKILSGPKFTNIYKYFTDEFVWPRGLPLEYILEKESAKAVRAKQNVGVWQFLANGDPDVDAIYRLTNNKPITFKDSEPVILDKNTISPFNSQNTLFKKEFFPLLYLPAYVTFRFTDILRGLVAQPLLWDQGHRLGFGGATVFQERNPHNYLKDFESEIPVYLHSEKVVDISNRVLESNAGAPLTNNLVAVYAALKDEGIVTDQELILLRAWLQDVSNLIGISK